MFSFEMRSPYPFKHDRILMKPGNPPVIMGWGEVQLPVGAQPSVMRHLIREQWFCHDESVGGVDSKGAEDVARDYPWPMALLWPAAESKVKWGVFTVGNYPVARWERELDGTMRRSLWTLWISTNNPRDLIHSWKEENDWIMVDLANRQDRRLLVGVHGTVSTDKMEVPLINRIHLGK